MAQTYKDSIVQAFRAAMDAHDAVTGLDAGLPDEVRVWHLVRSAIEFCDAIAPRLDFDAILSEVRSDLLETGDIGA